MHLAEDRSPYLDAMLLALPRDVRPFSMVGQFEDTVLANRPPARR